MNGTPIRPARRARPAPRRSRTMRSDRARVYWSTSQGRAGGHVLDITRMLPSTINQTVWLISLLHRYGTATRNHEGSLSSASLPRWTGSGLTWPGRVRERLHESCATRVVPEEQDGRHGPACRTDYARRSCKSFRGLALHDRNGGRGRPRGVGTRLSSVMYFQTLMFLTKLLPFTGLPSVIVQKRL